MLTTSSIENNYLKEVFSYWISLPRLTDVPKWLSFDVTKLSASIWPRLFLVDYIQSENLFRVRLAGTYIVNAFGRDSTGLRLTEKEMPGVGNSQILPDLHEMVTSRCPKHSFGVAAHRLTDRYEKAEVLLLPFVNDADAISVVMAAVDYVDFDEDGQVYSPVRMVR